MAQLLFEIGVEELPALSIEPAMEFMASYMDDALTKARLPHRGIKVFGTPRRLVLMVDELASRQPDFSEEILGPNVSIAFDQQGALTKAGLGFVRAKGLDESAVYRKKTDKGEVLAAQVLEPGQASKDLLPQLLLELMRAIPFKKRMRWESSGESFARPVRRLLCLYDGSYLPLSFADVLSGNTSSGHRFLSPEDFIVTSNSQYLSEMAQRFVILDPHERERIIIKEAQDKLSRLDAQFHEDKDLMAIVRNLMEYPFVIVGKFEEKYLAIPKEILVSEMKTHQKVFAVLDRSGALLPYFVCAAGTKPFDEEFFAKGNARVLRARFEDGAYYFAEDQKKTLREHALELKNLVFERELGFLSQKSERIEKIALALGKFFKLDEAALALIKKSAPLLKADLVTGVVGQFPELQGIMGRIYALQGKESADVAEIIESHYWPRFAEDKLPRLKAAALLSIADKLDTLVGIIAIDKRPKGNKDPFGLRRAAIGIVRLLVHFDLSIDLDVLVDEALSAYGQFEARRSALNAEVCDFIIQRARGILIEDLGQQSAEQSVSFADSILAVGSQNLLDAFARASALYGMRNKNPIEFDSLTQAFKRASNIVKKAQVSGEIVESTQDPEVFLTELCERDLLKAVRQTQQIIKNQSVREPHDLKASYADLFARVALIKPPLDAFFDGVMVMVEDKNVRQARLGLLSEIKQVADKIADFTHL